MENVSCFSFHQFSSGWCAEPGCCLLAQPAGMSWPVGRGFLLCCRLMQTRASTSPCPPGGRCANAKGLTSEAEEMAKLCFSIGWYRECCWSLAAQVWSRQASSSLLYWGFVTQDWSVASFWSFFFLSKAGYWAFVCLGFLIWTTEVMYFHSRNTESRLMSVT